MEIKSGVWVYICESPSVCMFQKCLTSSSRKEFRFVPFYSYITRHLHGQVDMHLFLIFENTQHQKYIYLIVSTAVSLCREAYLETGYTGQYDSERWVYKI